MIEVLSIGFMYLEFNLGGFDEDDFDLVLVVCFFFEIIFCFCL